MKPNQAEAVKILCSPQKIEAKFDEKGVISLHNIRTRVIEFKHKELNRVLSFFWVKTENKTITLLNSEKFKVIVSAYSIDGIAQFGLELHIKTEPHVVSIENMILETEQKARKTQLSRLPRSADSIIYSEWFKALRFMIRAFNERYFQSYSLR